MAKLFAWEQVQTLWTKIKNTFVAKDASGNVSVTGTLGVTGEATFNHDTTFNGDVKINNSNMELNDGHTITLYSEGDSKSSTFWCNDDGEMVINGGVIATITDVNTAVANAGHLKREKVATLPGVATALENVIYMVPATDGSGDDVFDEYMKIDGKLEKIGSNRVNLSGYSTTEQMNTAISTAVSNSYTLITDAEINSLS